MRRALRGAALLLLAVFVIPALAADDAKDAKKDPPKDAKKDDPKDVKKDDAKKDDAKKDAKKDDPKKDDTKKDDPKKDPPPKEVKKDNGMVRVGQLLGTVVNIDESKKKVRLKVDIPKENPQAALAVAQGQVELAQATFKRDYNGIVAAQRKIADNTRNLYTTTQVEDEWATTEDLVVRLAEPPQQIDDKGKIKKLTAAEKKELKGDPKLPGYKGEFSDMHTNQIVKVTLVRHKNQPKLKINPKTKDVDPELLAESKLQISMIEVLGEKRTP